MFYYSCAPFFPSVKQKIKLFLSFVLPHLTSSHQWCQAVPPPPSSNEAPCTSVSVFDWLGGSCCCFVMMTVELSVTVRALGLRRPTLPSRSQGWWCQIRHGACAPLDTNECAVLEGTVTKWWNSTDTVTFQQRPKSELRSVQTELTLNRSLWSSVKTFSFLLYSTQF